MLWSETMKYAILYLGLVSFSCFASKPVTPSKEYLNSLSSDDKAIVLEYEVLVKSEFLQHLETRSVDKLLLLIMLRKSIISDGATPTQALVDKIILKEAHRIYTFNVNKGLTEYQKSAFKKLKKSLDDNELLFEGHRAEEKKKKLNIIIDSFNF